MSDFYNKYKDLFEDDSNYDKKQYNSASKISLYNKDDNSQLNRIQKWENQLLGNSTNNQQQQNINMFKDPLQEPAFQNILQQQNKTQNIQNYNNRTNDTYQQFQLLQNQKQQQQNYPQQQNLQYQQQQQQQQNIMSKPPLPNNNYNNSNKVQGLLQQEQYNQQNKRQSLLKEQGKNLILNNVQPVQQNQMQFSSPANSTRSFASNYNNLNSPSQNLYNNNFNNNNNYNSQYNTPRQNSQQKQQTNQIIQQNNQPQQQFKVQNQNQSTFSVFPKEQQQQSNNKTSRDSPYRPTSIAKQPYIQHDSEFKSVNQVLNDFNQIKSKVQGGVRMHNQPLQNYGRSYKDILEKRAVVQQDQSRKQRLQQLLIQEGTIKKK